MKNNKDQLSSGITSRKDRTVNTIVFILLALGAVVMVFPFFYMIMTSFMTKNQYLSGQLRVIPDPWVWGKYSEVMSKGNFVSGILNTIKVEVPVLLIGGFTSSLAAFAFAKMNFRGKGAIFMGLLATIMIPFAVIMIPQYVMFTKFGWTDSLLPLIIPACFGNISMVFFLRQNLTSIPNDLMDAAKLDGCGYFRTFIQIFFPLMKGAVGTQITLWFMGIWNDYLAPTIFLRSEKNWTLQVVIRSFNTYYSIQSDYALIMAASVIAMLPTIILFFCFQRVIIESVAISGIK
ncbi:MAG: carbohydrate ABC transporter permease [Roseburia sp.]|nr:carbohydrate ABC transporter permease [Roseburia sp.]MCM1241478.1 carbohydrate ABC transporter permease [Roseburia sp.]